MYFDYIHSQLITLLLTDLPLPPYSLTYSVFFLNIHLSPTCPVHICFSNSDLVGSVHLSRNKSDMVST